MSMKKIFLSLAVIVFAFGLFLPAQNLKAQGQSKETKIEYVLFHLTTCPHCRDEIKFINKKLLPKYGQYIDLKMYEVSDQKNSDIFRQYGVFYNTEVGGVPMAFIDGEIIYGYGNDNTTGKQIMDTVERKLLEKGLIQNKIEDINIPDNQSKAPKYSGGPMILPVFGEVNPKNISLPGMTVVLGLLDGFNPCAMWVLLFLISLLLGMNDKKKRWLLGSIFIFISGFSYFVFMSAWLQLILFIGFIAIIRISIGLLASGVGVMSIWDSWKNRKVDGLFCKVSEFKDSKKTFNKIKEIVHRKNLWWSILGIVILGFSVNLVELACSAGFPAIFTQVLAINDIAMWQRYLYMFGYIFFYMLDDMIVFGIAMFTLQSASIGTKYAKYINFFSGVLIFVLGLLLIFKPEWLMFT